MNEDKRYTVIHKDVSMLSFIHISDCHLLSSRTEMTNGVNTFQSLLCVIDEIKLKQSNFDFILVTGDISQVNSRKSYELFKNMLRVFNVPVYCLPGNHDNATHLRRVFSTSPDETIDVQKFHNHLLISINSQRNDCQFGEISAAQLNALDNQLKKNTRPVILSLHHQPVKINSPWLDNIGLNNRETFLNLLGKYTLVKLILFGHVHQEIKSSYKHITILGSPSTGYQFQPLTETKTLDDLAPGYRTVEISDCGTILTQVHRVPYV